MLMKASKWLKPDGILVYSTCSLFSAEGERQIDWLNEQDSGLEPVSIDPNSHGLSPNMVNEAGQARLRPDFWAEHGGMDGFFIAKFKRTA